MDARHWRKLVTWAEAEKDDVLAHLPLQLREPASTLPVVFEPWISDDLVDTGLEPDLLGLFVGEPHGSPLSNDPMPPQIFLFLESIWQFVEGDEDAFREEVRITFFHELGHYLGLDEVDLEQRGLE